VVCSDDKITNECELGDQIKGNDNINTDHLLMHESYDHGLSYNQNDETQLPIKANVENQVLSLKFEESDTELRAENIFKMEPFDDELKEQNYEIETLVNKEESYSNMDSLSVDENERMETVYVNEVSFLVVIQYLHLAFNMHMYLY